MSPSKTMAARRQMRTPGERTSGAWTGGCAIHPDGGDETDRTAGNSYTATPHNTQASEMSQKYEQPAMAVRRAAALYTCPLCGKRTQVGIGGNYDIR